MPGQANSPLSNQTSIYRSTSSLLSSTMVSPGTGNHHTSYNTMGRGDVQSGEQPLVQPDQHPQVYLESVVIYRGQPCMTVMKCVVL